MKAFSLFLLFSFFTNAQEVKNPWIKKPLINMSAAYMEIHNPSDKEISLVKIEGPDAQYYEIHTHTKVDGVMKMRQLKKLPIKAKSSVTLKPKGHHIMLLEIPREKINELSGNLTLHFDNGKSIKVVAPIKDGL